MDPRVSSLLNRLGGLYRDPSRVDRDASGLLKSSVGQHLTPNIAPLVENNGDSHSTLVLQGTIAMQFRRNTYQLLVDIYLPSGYPSRPPICYVRLGAPNMYLKEHHAHVGSDGLVYLPYLHEWSPRTHNLIELVVAMSGVFGDDPPVFTRASKPPPSTRPAATSATMLDRDTQQQVEAAMIREAEEASRREEEERQEALRKQEAARREEEEMRAAQLAFEQRKYLQVQEALAKKLRSYLVDLSHQRARQIQSDQQDQQRLKRNQLAKQIDFMENLKSNLERQHETVDKATIDIQAWLAEQEASSSEKPHEQVSVDDLCVPSCHHHGKQMMDLAAENASLTDALYFLDRALQAGTLDLTSHLKHVRQLAKRQFLVRALLQKIAQVQIMNGK